MLMSDTCELLWFARFAIVDQVNTAVQFVLQIDVIIICIIILHITVTTI